MVVVSLLIFKREDVEVIPRLGEEVIALECVGADLEITCLFGESVRIAQLPVYHVIMSGKIQA